MSQPLRPYQARAVDGVRGHWAAGTSAVCLVAPTGAGKTRLGEELVDGAGAVVWIAHRRELVMQTAARLRSRFGKTAVGVIMPGEYETRDAKIQVATVQTLLARKTLPPCDRLVLDEAHHYAAEEWSRMARSYPKATTLGLTATPERKDGEPLGDIFGALVVAAHYSELIADGFLVPARVYRPASNLGNDLAQDPFDAWRGCSDGSQAFVFCARVQIARELAQRFRDSGITAALIECNTPKRERDDLLSRFRQGTIRVLTNVNTLTEGVDVPEARTVILARAFGHVGGFLQAAGRVLRPAKGKPDAIVVDLTGSTIRHGLPTDDRVYSLSGRAISGGAPPHGGGIAPAFSQEVRGVPLHVVAEGAKRVTDTTAPVGVDDVDRRLAYEQLHASMRKHGLRPAMAAIKYHERFGEWPSKEWSGT